MPTWLLIAALATIGITALLVALLYRINAPHRADAKQRRDAGADAGIAPVYFAGGHGRSRDDVNGNDDGGSDGGGADGGGGGGDGGG